jgi:nitrogen fixation-related uncharacterized protein
MDIELSSLVSLAIVNFIVLLGIVIYLTFFYKWDPKQYHDMD